MPSSTQAALVFLVVVLPGFLAQGGYRFGRAVPEHAEGLIAVARVIALSTLIVLVAWKFGGETVYRHAQESTALTADASHTYRFAVALFALPPVVGFVLGQVVDALARRLGSAADQTARDGAGSRTAACRRWAIAALVPRLINEGPTTWDRTWRRLRRTEPFAYARVVTKGGREIVGVIANDSRVALSPQPHDLFLEQVLRQGADGNFYPTAHGLGAFLAGSEIESVEWVSQQGLITSEDDHGGAPDAADHGARDPRGRTADDRTTAGYGNRLHRLRARAAVFVQRFRPGSRRRELVADPAVTDRSRSPSEERDEG